MRLRDDIPPPNDYLLGFYDLLAMIQTPCFMFRYSHSAVVSVSDSQMKLLEWLHEEIRNDFEHFIPKTLLASCDDCLHASEVCLRLTTDILTKSNNVMPSGIEELQIKLPSVSISVATLRADLNDS